MALDNETKQEKPVYLDASHPLNRRIEDLLDRMTLEEKSKQMYTLYSLWDSLSGEEGSGGFAETRFKRMTPEDKAEFIKRHELEGPILEKGR